MHYEINVSHEGKHLFATHPRSLLDEGSARALYALFQVKFPRRQGYEITLVKHSTTSQQVL